MSRCELSSKLITFLEAAIRRLEAHAIFKIMNVRFLNISVINTEIYFFQVLVVRYRTLEELKNITGFLLLRNYKILDIQKKIRYIICKYKTTK